MKRTFVVLGLLIFTGLVIALPERRAAQSASPTPTPTDAFVFETVKAFLLISAATDFTEHQPPYPSKFRNVRIGHVGDTTKSGSYRMCGEFLPSDGGDKAEWIGFASIKTSGYEQYIGSGTTYCTDAKIVWDTTDELSPTLKRLLGSIKKSNEETTQPE
jgi:hypothetical protein